MSYITAEEWELSSLFGVEPKRLDPGVPWPYNDFVYEVQQSEMSLSVTVAPACKDVRIILKSGSVSLYDQRTHQLADDVRIHDAITRANSASSTWRSEAPSRSKAPARTIFGSP